jgi:hypothetical protein
MSKESKLNKLENELRILKREKGEVDFKLKKLLRQDNKLK